MLLLCYIKKSEAAASGFFSVKNIDKLYPKQL